MSCGFFAHKRIPPLSFQNSIAGSATDIDAGDTLTYSKTAGPVWLSVASNGALSGMPGAGDTGPNAFTVQAATATLNITVVAAPVTGPGIRVTEYYLATGDFSGTSTTLTLSQDLANDYYILVRGSRTGSANSYPDNNYARVSAVPGGKGGLADSGSANQIQLARFVADVDWEGVVTVVECTNATSAAGFKLVDVVETSLTGTSGTDTSAAWNDVNQVVLFGGYRGGGTALAGATTLNRKQVTSAHTRLYPSGTSTLNWTRDAGGETLVDAVMTTFVVEWGGEWNVQHVNVAGVNGGNGANATGEYTTATV